MALSASEAFAFPDSPRRGIWLASSAGSAAKLLERIAAGIAAKIGGSFYPDASTRRAEKHPLTLP